MRVLTPLLLLLTLAAPLRAQGWIEPRPNLPAPMGVVKVRTAVSVHVTGRVARVEVEEWFRNDGGGMGEGDYLYPLPGEASFADFSLFQGDQELRGETMDAGQARGIYEEIVRRRKDPALIELAGHGLLRARVFPINPGETRRIVLRYNQVLSRAGDALLFRYAAGARNGGMGTNSEGQATLRRQREPAPLSFTLTADDGESFRDPFSPTHEVRVAREEGRVRVRSVAGLEGDFSLFLPLARGLVGMTLATHRPAGEDGYFMLTLSPGEATGPALPRDLTVVVDVSGSMSGEKMEQARGAISQLLGTLDGRDRFRLIAFSNAVRAQKPAWSPATPAALQEARRWVEALRAEGGTNIAGALAEAFRLSTPEGRLPMVVFLTDGLPSVGEQNPERIARQVEGARGEARIHAVGVGFDVNTYLLDRLGEAGRGSTQYVEPQDDVEQAVGTLAARIRHPVLSDLRIAGAPVRLTEVYPAPLPDLFAGQELVIFGRYRPGPTPWVGPMQVAGRRSGAVERFSLAASFPEHEEANDYIPRLWGARKLGVLMQQIRLEGPSEALVAEVREVALRYGLLSEYTSYLVLEPGMDVTSTAFPQPMPVRGEISRGRESGTPPPVAAPASPQSGQAAVRASQQARARRAVANATSLEMAEEGAATDAAAAGAGVRIVAGRRFADRQGVWTDLAHADSLRLVSVEPFSRAYFDLLRLAPELRPYWSAFERVTVAGRRASVRVAPGGVREMDAAQAARLVRDLRGG